MLGTSPQCLLCDHLTELDADVRTCPAFPNGIPDEIWENQVDHRQPTGDDNGIVFQPAPDASPEQLQLLYESLDAMRGTQDDMEDEVVEPV